MQTSDELDKISPAIVAALADIENATKDAQNRHFQSTYATLAALIDATKSGLAKHGLAVIQSPGFEGGLVLVTTRVLHTSGQWIEGVVSSPIGKSDPQGVGSAITYLRRYALAAMCGITQEDDDGNGAAKVKPTSKSAPKNPEVTDIEWAALKADLAQIDAMADAPDTAKAHAVVDARNAELYARVRSYASDLLR